MANIVSSVFEAFVQANGTSIVHEKHTDLVGLVHDIVYTAQAGADLAAAMATHAQSLGNDLATQEVQDNMLRAMTQGKFAQNTTVYSTAQQNTAALNVAWPGLLNTQAIFIGEYLNTFSDAILESVFGWTPAHTASVRSTFLGPYATMAASIRSATGTL